MQWTLSGVGMRGTDGHVHVITCWHLPISLNKLRASGSGHQRSLLQLGQNGEIWTAECTSPSSWLQQLWLQPSDMFEAAHKSSTKQRPDFHGAMEQPSGHLASDLHRPVGCMAWKTTLAFNTAEPMGSSKGIDVTSTLVTDVWLTKWCTQTKTNSYPGCVIIHL